VGERRLQGAIVMSSQREVGAHVGDAGAATARAMLRGGVPDLVAKATQSRCHVVDTRVGGGPPTCRLELWHPGQRTRRSERRPGLHHIVTSGPEIAGTLGVSGSGVAIAPGDMCPCATTSAEIRPTNRTATHSGLRKDTR
jgi:hypothetical protein